MKHKRVIYVVIILLMTLVLGYLLFTGCHLTDINEAVYSS